MKAKFNIITSTCVPLPLENVDTDQIIPARFLKATYHYTEAISGYCPCSMFTAGTRTKVLSCHQYLSSIGGIVQHKVFI